MSISWTMIAYKCTYQSFLTPCFFPLLLRANSLVLYLAKETPLMSLRATRVYTTPASWPRHHWRAHIARGGLVFAIERVSSGSVIRIVGWR